MPPTLKTTCCRSLPRCASCPVVLAATGRPRTSRSVTAALVEDILRGTHRELPDPVTHALAGLARARSQRDAARMLTTAL